MSERGQQVLNCPMVPNDVEAPDIRTYLACLLTALWKEGEGFSGKRPFGNSGWELDIITSLVKAELVPGTFDSEFGYLVEVNEGKARALVDEAIATLMGTS